MRHSEEHDESVQSNDSVGCAQEDSDDGQLRAFLLAVNVAILPKLQLGFQEIHSQILLSPIDASFRDSEISVPSVCAPFGVVFCPVGLIFRLEGTIRVDRCNELVVSSFSVPVFFRRTRRVVCAGVPASRSPGRSGPTV